MTMPKLTAFTSATQTAPQPVTLPPDRSAAWHCLVLSADSRRRTLLADAAIEGGWSAICCPDAQSAEAETYRRLVQLALIDLGERDGPAPRVRSLVEQLAAQPDLLVALCGSEANPPQEVWARQLGAWLYLPKITATSDLASICGEALRLSAQRSRTTRSSPGGHRASPHSRGRK